MLSKVIEERDGVGLYSVVLSNERIDICEVYKEEGIRRGMGKSK